MSEKLDRTEWTDEDPWKSRSRDSERREKRREERPKRSDPYHSDDASEEGESRMHSSKTDSRKKRTDESKPRHKADRHSKPRHSDERKDEDHRRSGSESPRRHRHKERSRRNRDSSPSYYSDDDDDRKAHRRDRHRGRDEDRHRNRRPSPSENDPHRGKDTDAPSEVLWPMTGPADDWNGKFAKDDGQGHDGWNADDGDGDWNGDNKWSSKHHDSSRRDGDRDRNRGRDDYGYGGRRDRDHDRGYCRDRDRDRGYDDRDRGGYRDRDNDRGYGGGAYGDRDYDRGYGNGGRDRDRDRDRGGYRDRDHDRGYGAGGYGDRDNDRGYGGGSYGGGGGFGGYGGDSYEAKFENIRDIAWDNERLETFTRDFYCESPVVTAMTPDDVEQMRQKYRIKVFGDRVPKCVPDMISAGFSEEITKVLMQFPSPTPIQMQGWPIALSGYNMVGVAETGSGKTLAFILPALMHIKAQPPVKPGDGPIALVLAPTRELTQQISDTTLPYAGTMGFRCIAVYGGVQNRREQSDALRSGVEIVAACPGRLCDYLNTRVTNLKRVTYFVLDEADRMLDMGFGPEVERIATQIRPDRQTLMWSATWPYQVHQIAQRVFRGDPPLKVVIGGDADQTCAGKTEHEFIVVQGYDEWSKWQQLREWFDQHHAESKRILMFMKTKRECDDMVARICTECPNMLAQAIHGDKSQDMRNQALQNFKTGVTNVLVATDVMARGIDINSIWAVVNWSIPNTVEEYIHRTGRTGRAGAEGLALSIVSTSDYNVLSALEPVFASSGVSCESLKKAMNDLGQCSWVG